ncbi:hypothetical protein E1269_26445 [Jiangella asiatica]|uniref:Uncharacterized protein n=1 Tax=Jiangella asiatica TaxID=2530372 RepID=A0A4R5CIS4_9ACTN|nr:hypothetical protein E1269_26445 [Jiangella asiatica]
MASPAVTLSDSRHPRGKRTDQVTIDSIESMSKQRPGVGAHGGGATPEEAVADLRVALVGLVVEFGAPDELT